MVRRDPVEDHAGKDGLRLARGLVWERVPVVRPGARAVQCAERESVSEDGGAAVDGVAVPVTGRHRPGRMPPFLMSIMEVSMAEPPRPRQRPLTPVAHC